MPTSAPRAGARLAPGPSLLVRPRHAWLVALATLSALAVLLLAPGQAGAAGWTKQYTQTYFFSDIQFVDTQHGWAVGGNGSIAATADAGATWKAQTSGTTQAFSAVDFVDAQFGWAVGPDGNVVATTNGGATWTKQTCDASLDLYAVSFINRTQGWACGYYGVIVQTTDGGTTWTRIGWPFGEYVYQTQTFVCIAMVDAAHGFMVGEDRIAWPTGSTPPWGQSQPATTRQDSYKAVDCVSSTRAVVVGSTTGNPASKAVAYMTSDGSTWQRLAAAPATTEYYNDVSMPSANTIVIGGSDGDVWASTDAGATWTSYGKASAGYATLDFVDATHGWVACGGSIYKYGAAAARPVPRALANVIVKRGQTATLPYRVDCAAATCKVTIRILRGSKAVKTFSIAKAKTNTKATKRFKCTLAKGRYTWSITAVADGAKSAKASSRKLTVK